MNQESKKPTGREVGDRQADNSPKAMVPLFWSVGERPCLVVGGGRVACRKVRWLLECGAAVQVVAPRIEPDLRTLQRAQPERLRLCREAYDQRKWRLAEFALVLVACGEDAVNRQIHREAKAAGVPLNVADIPELCDFHVPATVHRGSLRIAIGTGGRCPGLAGHLRRKLDAELSPKYAELADKLSAERIRLREQPGTTAAQRHSAMRDFLEKLLLECE